jgi:hypothetical protein
MAAALADVTYSYTGNLFNQTSATVMWEGGLPDEWEAHSAGVATALRDDRVTISFSSPVYIPVGWSSFGSTYEGYQGALVAPLQALANSGVQSPGITWSVNSSVFNGDGHIALVFDPLTYNWNYASGISVAVHVGVDHQIDAWDLRMWPGLLVGPSQGSWSQELTSSNINGDVASSASIEHSLVAILNAANATPGTWEVSGTPLAVVPEPATYAMLLAGLAVLGTFRRRQTRRT